MRHDMMRIIHEAPDMQVEDLGSRDAMDGLASSKDGLASRCMTQAITYNESTYLAVFTDVIVSLDLGEFRTGREHYETHGAREGRLTDERYVKARGLTDVDGIQAEFPFSIDSILYSWGGFALIVGWVDDRTSPLSSLSIFAREGGSWNTTGFGRVRRDDAEDALSAPAGHLFGFWLVVQLGKDLTVTQPWAIRGRLANGHFTQAEVSARQLSDTNLRTTILSYFAETKYLGNREIESFLSLEADIGWELVQLNRSITNAVLAGAWVTYYGPQRKAYDGSILVCLFGKLEFIFLQSAFFSMSVGAENYEFIYVSNSPELTEALEKEARLCAKIYGISIVLVCLPDNAGFGAANNIAARYARSKRLMITNPDVFPRDKDWAARHLALIENLPADQTRIFGAPLYYDDGSLMHHGMYFEIDEGISVKPDSISTRRIIRTEHYAKGAPAWSPQFVCPRKVSAITGAFISIDRAWFERLGGFNEEFLFGHYEDADLSLRSLACGQPVWMQDFPLWHMEGEGSIRLQEHEGGILVNRWLFTKRWGELIAKDLRGPNPSCAALQMSAPIVAPLAAPALAPGTSEPLVVAPRKQTERRRASGQARGKGLDGVYVCFPSVD
jgi:GT2 family glycosyltransferase